jgi:hypothetical protein
LVQILRTGEGGGFMVSLVEKEERVLLLL